MASMLRVPGIALALVILVIVLAGGLYAVAGRQAPPRVTIDKPERFVGQSGTLEVTAEAPDGRFQTLTIALEQNGRRIPLFTLLGERAATITPIGRDAMRITRPFGKEQVPELQAGPARIVVTASRRSILNLRTLSRTVTRDVQVRLEPPRRAALSTHPYLNHRG